VLFSAFGEVSLEERPQVLMCTVWNLKRTEIMVVELRLLLSLVFRSFNVQLIKYIPVD